MAWPGAAKTVFLARKLQITQIKFMVIEYIPGAIHGAIDVCGYPHDGEDMGTIWQKLVINLVYVCTKKCPMSAYQSKY